MWLVLQVSVLQRLDVACHIDLNIILNKYTEYKNISLNPLVSDIGQFAGIRIHIGKRKMILEHLN